jgi:hypothetical protein
MNKVGLSTAVAIAMLMGASLANAATIVQNGSFEEDPGVNGQRGYSYTDIANGVDGGWDTFGSLPGWAADTDGVEVQGQFTIPLTPYDGDYYVELDTSQNSGINQTIALGIGRYLMSFAFSPRQASTTTNAISYGIDGLFSDLVNGPGGALSTIVGEWTMVTREFVVASAGDYSMFFDAASKSDSYGGFIDDIKVSAVPVPAAGFLLFGALGGLAALRRRKATAA